MIRADGADADRGGHASSVHVCPVIGLGTVQVWKIRDYRVKVIFSGLELGGPY